MNKSHVSIITLHVNIIYLACRGSKLLYEFKKLDKIKAVYVSFDTSFLNCFIDTVTNYLTIYYACFDVHTCKFNRAKFIISLQINFKLMETIITIAYTLTPPK